LSEKAWDACDRPEKIYVSCVSSPQYKQQLISYFETKWQLTPDFLISPANGFGITNAYPEPSRLGSDRWAAMVAAYNESQSAVLVVDAGTALTIDAIDAQGKHLGGLIYPGLSLTHNMLETGTQMDFDLNEMELKDSDFFQNSTEKGIYSGTTQGMASLIDRAYRELMTINHSAEPVCYLTGGDAEQIKNTLQCSCQLEPVLVLKGLALIASAP
jgi:type III pantothenate kinase